MTQYSHDLTINSVTTCPVRARTNRQINWRMQVQDLMGTHRSRGLAGGNSRAKVERDEQRGREDVVCDGVEESVEVLQSLAPPLPDERASETVGNLERGNERHDLYL
jgi:hypothetical protein